MIKTVLIDLNELKKLPYVKCDDIQNRIVPILPYYDGSDWQISIFSGGTIISLKGSPVEGDYFSQNPEKESDIYFEFLNFIIQRAFWPDVGWAIDAIRNDIHNLGASLGKFQLFYEHSIDHKQVVARYVASELEYIFIVCRSIFDLLQLIIARMWNKIELKDKNIKKNQLPKSFRAMVLYDNELMDTQTIKNKFKIPNQLAEFYARQAPFFDKVKKYRDSIEHRGVNFKTIFITDRGFAVDINKKPFSSFGVWNKTNLLPNDLGSLRPVIAHLMNETFLACEDFSLTIQQIIVFPPDIAPGNKIFIRGHHSIELLKLESILNNCSWWDE